MSGHRAWDRDGTVKLPERVRHLRPGMVLGVSDNACGQQMRAEMPNGPPSPPAGRASWEAVRVLARCVAGGFVKSRHGGSGWACATNVPVDEKTIRNIRAE